jgi:hypothetical protein
MRVDKLEPILAFAISMGAETFPVLIDFGGAALEQFRLTKREILNISEWEEIISISLEDIKGKDSQGNPIERRWRERN